jgi:hypothetical protein
MMLQLYLDPDPKFRTWMPDPDPLTIKPIESQSVSATLATCSNLEISVLHLDTVEGIIRHFNGEYGIPLLVQYIPGVQYPVLISKMYICGTSTYCTVKNTKRNVLLLVQRVQRYYRRARLFGSRLDCALGQRACARTFVLLVGYGQF